MHAQLEGRILKQVAVKDVLLKRDFYLITVGDRYSSPASVKFRELLVTGGGSTGLVPDLT